MAIFEAGGKGGEGAERGRRQEESLIYVFYVVFLCVIHVCVCAFFVLPFYLISCFSSFIGFEFVESLKLLYL